MASHPAVIASNGSKSMIGGVPIGETLLCASTPGVHLRVHAGALVLRRACPATARGVCPVRVYHLCVAVPLCPLDGPCTWQGNPCRNGAFARPGAAERRPTRSCAPLGSALPKQRASAAACSTACSGDCASAAHLDGAAPWRLHVSIAGRPGGSAPWWPCLDGGSSRSRCALTRCALTRCVFTAARLGGRVFSRRRLLAAGSSGRRVSVAVVWGGEGGSYVEVWVQRSSQSFIKVSNRAGCSICRLWPATSRTANVARG